MIKVGVDFTKNVNFEVLSFKAGFEELTKCNTVLTKRLLDNAFPIVTSLENSDQCQQQI